MKRGGPLRRLTARPTLLRGDARRIPLADNTVDLVVTSPPYWSLRDYGTVDQLGAEPSWQAYLDNLIDCTREWVRVLKPSGSLFVNLGDKYGPDKSLLDLPWRYGIRCRDELGLIKRAEIIWSKVNGLPESVVDRVRRSHEVFLHLTLRPRYFEAVDEIRETSAYVGPTWEQRKAAGQPMRHGDTGGGASAGAAGGMAVNPMGKLPGSVWTIPTQPLKVPAELGVDHFAAFPMEWPRRLILGWSPPDGVVLDPFSGTGTTALVATMLGRQGVGVELNPDYIRLAEWRAADPKERARAAGLDPDAVAQIKPELPGQESLLDLLGGEAS